jgi:hypothetical protein
MKSLSTITMILDSDNRMIILSLDDAYIPVSGQGFEIWKGSKREHICALKSIGTLIYYTDIGCHFWLH